ncbi:MAG: DUF1566 domain-containing protein [Verrucomicrobiales bacterium]|nr:DUF1566 domain-containing protein [Verrucomicrobiota bacterium JB025]
MRLPSTKLTGLILCLSAACAMGQTASITSISPDSAVQGATDQLVTFTVTGAILPPVGATPNSVTIGDISGSSVSYASANTITAIFDFPADEAVGAKDAVVVWYPTDGDTITVGSTGGFTVTAAGDTAPGISSQPASQTVAPGDTVSFSITASGTEPMSYEWFKDDVSLGDATTEPSHTIDAAEAADAGTYVCVVTNDFGSVTSDGAVLTVRELEPGLFVMVDTGQATCYSDTEEITAPGPGDSFAGQDAQYAGAEASYTVSDDGLTVYDNHTGLTWIRSTDTDGDGDIDADDKLTYDEQFSYADARNAESFGGYSDWRVPSIKEVYSLMDFRGMDPSGYEGTDTSGLVPFIDDDVFEFAYGDTDAGERIIDSQYGSTNLYVDGEDLLFGVNFADGRIKGYGLTLFGVDKTFFVMLCRGNESYGVNDFEETGEGTVLDHSTGLMWQQGDSVDGLDWEEALAYAENLELGGYSDWRLPNAKELQAIVDYTRSPGTPDSGAIDAVFTCTPITNDRPVRVTTRCIGPGRPTRTGRMPSGACTSPSDGRWDTPPRTAGRTFTGPAASAAIRRAGVRATTPKRPAGITTAMPRRATTSASTTTCAACAAARKSPRTTRTATA